MSVNTMTGDLMHADIRAAAGVNDAILAIGRILIAIIFVSSGVEKFMDLGATTSAIASKSLPYERSRRADGDRGGGRRPSHHFRLANPARRTGARDLLRRRGLLLP